jgi:hypothetical protein
MNKTHIFFIAEEETDEVLPMNDFTDSHLQEMHAFTGKLMKILKVSIQ